MAELARRFATKVILFHLLALAAVVALVLAAASQLYWDARRQLLAQTVARQQLIAGQTSRAVAEFFDGMLDNLDLVRRSEGAEVVRPRERVRIELYRRADGVRSPFGGPPQGQWGPGGNGRESPATLPARPQRPAPRGGSDGAPDRQGGATGQRLGMLPAILPGLGQGGSPLGSSLLTVGAAVLTGQVEAPRLQPRPQGGPGGGLGGGQGGNGGANQSIAMMLWRQVEGRASHLFSFDPRTGTAFEIGRHEESVAVSEILPEVRDELRAAERAGVSRVHALRKPVQGDRAAASMAAQDRGTEQASSSPAARLSGGAANEFVVVYAPVMARVEPAGGAVGAGGGIGGGAETQRRVLAAVVPIDAVRQRFLEEIAAAKGIEYALFDTASGLVHASDSSLAGLSRTALKGVTPESETPLSSSALTSAPPSTRPTGEASGPGAKLVTYVLSEGLAIGGDGKGTRVPPCVLVMADVDIEGPDWTLAVASPLSEVDALIEGVYRRTMFWSAFLVMATALVLVSTSTRVIRDRVRLEREQQAALRRDLDQARRIQLEWLPAAFPAHPALTVHALNLPASHVSGDLYNWFALDDQRGGNGAARRYAFVIGDVTGHGMSAAMQMSSVQLLVLAALRSTRDPGAALTQVNATLCLHDFSGQFVTLLIAVVDIETGTVAIATAGHPGPIRLQGAQIEEIALEPELMLGVSGDVTYHTQRFELPAGATLVLYTDGLPEAFGPGPKAQQFGLEGTFATLKALAGDDSPQRVNEALAQAVEAHLGHRPPADDLTLLTVRLGKA